jgi:hypothetical protein
MKSDHETPIFRRSPGHDLGILGVARICDLVLVTSPEIVKWYETERIPSIYFPLATSTKVYFPIEGVEKIYDVGFIGNRYGIREKLINYLQKNGISVRAHGSGWKEGRIHFNQNNLFFNQCKIVLGIGTVGHCANLFTLKLRDFDAPASGGCYITHHNSDLIGIFGEDSGLTLCRSFSDFLDNIRSLLKDDDKRELLARKAYETVLSKHTYSRRFTNLFNILMTGEGEVFIPSEPNSK